MPVSFADIKATSPIKLKFSVGRVRFRTPPSPSYGKRGINSKHGPAGHHNTGSRKKPRTSRGGRKCKTCRKGRR